MIKLSIYNVEVVGISFKTVSFRNNMLSGKYSSAKYRGRKFTIVSYSLFLALILLFLSPSIDSEDKKDTGWDDYSIITDTDLNDVLALN